MAAEGAARGLYPRLRETAAARRAEGCDLRHAADPAHPDVDDLDRARLEDMPVLDPVQLAEAEQNLAQRSRVERIVGKWDTQLVALSDIAQIARALEPRIGGGNPVGRQLPRQLHLHRDEVAIQPVETDRVAGLKYEADGGVFEVGRQEADPRGHPGVGLHDDFGDAE